MTEPAPPSCSLDREEMAVQGQRYAEIGRSARAVERSSLLLTVTLAPSADRALVEEALRVESDCCPFFELAFEPESSRLSIGVASEEMAPALDAITSAIGLEPIPAGA